MFGQIAEKFYSVFSKLSSKKTLTAENISEAVSDVRLALLEADVQYAVVKNFIKRVKEKAEGEELIKSVRPGEQFAKIVHDELVLLMGGDEEVLKLSKKPSHILFVGLQGSGKTTATVKLTRYLLRKKEAERPLVVACDLQRPAAICQLQTLAKEAGVTCFALENEKNPLVVASKGIEFAKKQNHDVVIFDTAGRLHVDEELMNELSEMKKLTNPEEVLYVASAATGQDAVRSATTFSTQIGITGTILTMLDGSMRGGAAISIREVTGKPLKFESVGERIDDFQLFNPRSMADRILGMGDTINLVRKAEEHFKEEEAKDLEEKLKKASFTYEDYLNYLKSLKKMGSMKSLFKMLPGMSMMKDIDFDDKDMFQFEGMIHSMTKSERQGKCELTIPRRKRIAKGCGRTIDDVNKAIKSFNKTKDFFKNMPNKKTLEKMMGGLLWR